MQEILKALLPGFTDGGVHAPAQNACNIDLEGRRRASVTVIFRLLACSQRVAQQNIRLQSRKSGIRAPNRFCGFEINLSEANLAACCGRKTDAPFSFNVNMLAGSNRALKISTKVLISLHLDGSSVWSRFSSAFTDSL